MERDWQMHTTILFAFNFLRKNITYLTIYNTGWLPLWPYFRTGKKEKKISSYIRKFRGIGCKVIYDKWPTHIWWKYLCISSYIGNPFLIYDFAPDPIWISLYRRKFCFLFYQCECKNFVITKLEVILLLLKVVGTQWLISGNRLYHHSAWPIIAGLYPDLFWPLTVYIITRAVGLESQCWHCPSLLPTGHSTQHSKSRKGGGGLKRYNLYLKLIYNPSPAPLYSFCI